MTSTHRHPKIPKNPTNMSPSHQWGPSQNEFGAFGVHLGPFGSFLKWGYPQIIHLGVPPFMETPIWVCLGLFGLRTICIYSELLIQDEALWPLRFPFGSSVGNRTSTVGLQTFDHQDRQDPSNRILLGAKNGASPKHRWWFSHRVNGHKLGGESPLTSKNWELWLSLSCKGGSTPQISNFVRCFNGDDPGPLDGEGPVLKSIGGPSPRSILWQWLHQLYSHHIQWSTHEKVDMFVVPGEPNHNPVFVGYM